MFSSTYSTERACQRSILILWSRLFVTPSSVKNYGNWVKAGIPIINDLAILKKIKKLREDHRALAKNKKKPNSNLVQRELFSEKLDQLFDICVPDVEERLQVDRLRDQQARVEDLEFLEDQRDTERRKMCVGKVRDKDYECAIHHKF